MTVKRLDVIRGKHSNTVDIRLVIADVITGNN